MLPQQENIPLARRLAWDALAHSSLPERALRSGGSYGVDARGRPGLGVTYLGLDLWLSFPEGRLVVPEGQGPVSPREEILILHYLARSKGGLPTGQWISFANIPGGAFYHPVFQKRCQEPLIRFFGGQPEALSVIAAAAMGAGPIALGDVAVRIPALPTVPLGLVLWRGDADFPPEGSVLFDASVREKLPVEDIVVLAETVVWKLVRAKKQSAERKE